MEELYRFRQFLTEGVIKEELVDKIKQIKDYNETEDSLNYGGYDITYDRDENLYNVFSKEGDSDSSDIPDFESSNPSAIEDFLLKEEQGYTLYTTNVEYDNGKTGYMYQLVNSEDREENEIGFDQLYFDDEDNRLEMGVDFKDFDQSSYQEEEVSAEEAMKIYSKVK